MMLCIDKGNTRSLCVEVGSTSCVPRCLLRVYQLRPKVAAWSVSVVSPG